MQTFLPYKSFAESASVLDNRRLGKQRIEAYQIAIAIKRPTYAWQYHPATKMWRGYLPCLISYAHAMIDEWIKRGYNDTLRPRLILPSETTIITPPWLGDERVHSSHRANLLRKDPMHYGQFGWEESPIEGYFWPV